MVYLIINHITSCSLVFIFNRLSQSSNRKLSIKLYQYSHICLGDNSGLLNWLNRLISLLIKACWPRWIHSPGKINRYIFSFQYCSNKT